MNTKHLAEIISEGKQLAHSIYEERNAIISKPHFGPKEDLADHLLEVHDDLVLRFAQMETLLIPDEPEKKTKSASSTVRDLVVYHMPDDWTLTDLANTSGVSASTISKLISGESTPRRGTLAKIEAALGLEEGALDG